MTSNSKKAKLSEAPGAKVILKTDVTKAAMTKNPQPGSAHSAAQGHAGSKVSIDSNLQAGIGTARQFLKEVAVEFNKITWPGRTQVIQETYSVLFLVTIITLMVLAFDWFLGRAIFGPLEYWARLHGGGVGRG